jgi:hypothetical protein
MDSLPKVAALAAVSLLSFTGCGGGGGGDSSASTETSMSIATASVSAAAGYGDYAPTRTVRLTATNVPDGGLYIGIEASGQAVSFVDFSPISNTQVDLVVQFRQPVELPVGTATASIRVEVCYDEQCTRQVRGSPASLAASYSVTSPSTVGLGTALVSATGYMHDTTQPQAIAMVDVSNPPDNNLTFVLTQAATNVQSVTNLSGNTNVVNLQLNFRMAAYAGVGVHIEDVAVRACYDSSCVREVPGSPLVIHTTYTVSSSVPPEPGLTPLPYVSRTPLSHDVIDAEYDRALDAIVMVSSSPTNALYLYDVSDGTERQLSLNSSPTAVSVSPDGQFAAVGHDALITHVDLQALIAGAPVTKLLNVSTVVFDVVLDGRGNVHALPAADQWVSVHSVEVATNTETLGTGSLYAGTRGRLHPSGDYMYTANNGLSPSDIAKYDVRSGTANELYDSPYHGDYAMCGDVWLAENGATIYTKCGNTFRSSTTQSQDMVYSGRLQLSTSQYYGFVIQALSQADATKEIMLIEADSYECAPHSANNRCYTHLALYESDFLNRAALYSLPSIELGGSTYSQRGAFVFHSSDGLHRYMISRLYGAPGATQPHYLTVVQ